MQLNQQNIVIDAIGVWDEKIKDFVVPEGEEFEKSLRFKIYLSSKSLGEFPLSFFNKPSEY